MESNAAQLKSIALCIWITLIFGYVSVNVQAGECGSPPVPDHGDIFQDPESTVIQWKVACDPGYNLHGPSIITCLATGKWSATSLSCIPESGTSTSTANTPRRRSETSSISPTRATTEDCGGNYTDMSGWFTSPNFPDHYNNNDTCYYYISVPVGHVIRLTFVAFQLEPSANCVFDHLAVYDGPSNDGSFLIARLCGTSLPKPIESSHNELTLVFETDWAAYDMGFNVTYMATAGSTTTASSPDTITSTFTATTITTETMSSIAPSTTRVTIPTSTQGIRCPELIDPDGYHWTSVPAGTTLQLACKPGYSGVVSRECSAGGVWLRSVLDCSTLSLHNISELFQGNVSEATLTSSLEHLAAVTSPHTGSSLTQTDITKVTDLLEQAAAISDGDDITVSTSQAQTFLATASNLLDSKNVGAWSTVSQNNKTAGVSRVLTVVDTYSGAIFNSLNDTVTQKTVAANNLVLHVSQVQPDDTSGMDFPYRRGEYDVNSYLHIPSSALNGSRKFSAVVYNNLVGLLPDKATLNITNKTVRLNSEVVSVKLDNWTQASNFRVSLDLGILKTNMNNPKCVFWDEQQSAWNDEGCKLRAAEATVAYCECDHLTNFAILMSPFAEDVDSVALDVVSMVGCSVSLLALVITLVVHIIYWRKVKSDRAVILINLCVALTASYVLFLAGIDRTENKAVCTSIAVLLQYIYLVVFFIMLTEGIEIAWTMLYVFTTSSRIRWLLPLAWALPAVIVAISLGATQLEGYGTDQFCWLSKENGLIWAFVAPALLIIVVNAVLLFLVMRAMMRTRMISGKSDWEKVKMGARCLCVLLPLMGCTWVIGIFYVNESMAWIQYVFAVCNGLQGCVIFVFHCLLNKQIRTARESKHSKYIKTQTTDRSGNWSSDSVDGNVTVRVIKKKVSEENSRIKLEMD